MVVITAAITAVIMDVITVELLFNYLPKENLLSLEYDDVFRMQTQTYTDGKDARTHARTHARTLTHARIRSCCSSYTSHIDTVLPASTMSAH